MNQTLQFTRHSEQRFSQRGLSKADLALIMECATETSADAYIVRDREIDQAIVQRRHEISRLEHLRRVKLVAREGVIVTGFKATHQQCCRELRGIKRKGIRK